MTAGTEIAFAFSPRRVAAMMLRYWYLLRSSWPRLIELVYWPTVQMFTWGFLQSPGEAPPFVRKKKAVTPARPTRCSGSGAPTR